MFRPEEHQGACEAMRRHALACWPNEACGMILADGFMPLRNVSPEPQDHFDCDVERAPFVASGRVLAMVHSHPYPVVDRLTSGLPASYGPSEHDMRAQIADAVPWGICATDGQQVSELMFWSDDLEPLPLLGRMFRHGPSGSDGRGDCYALIRDFYRQERGITLPEFPRSYEWWARGGDLYLEGFSKAGFRAIAPEDARSGDVFLAHIQSATVNHGGILLDGGLIMHHLGQRMSRHDSLLAWRRLIVRWLRHERCD